MHFTQYTPLRSVRKATKAAAVAVGITAVAGTASGRPGTRPGTCSSPDTPPSVDDLLPRTDISGQVTAQLLGMIGSAQPKERMKGVDAVDELLRGVGGRIGPDVGDLLPALKVGLLALTAATVVVVVALLLLLCEFDVCLSTQH